MACDLHLQIVAFNRAVDLARNMERVIHELREDAAQITPSGMEEPGVADDRRRIVASYTARTVAGESWF